MPFHKSARLAALLLAAVFLPLTCSGCSLPFQKQDGDGSGYLFTASLASNPKSLDPQSATDASSKTIIENLYEGLMELDETGTPQPAAAESYTISPDGCTYTFVLHNDRYWFFDENQNDEIDDGEKWAVTAADYVYAFQRIFNPETQSPYTNAFSCLKNAQAIQSGQEDYTTIGVQAISSTQLQFTLDHPNTRFLSLLATTAAMPCSQSFFEQTKGRYGLDQDSVASCGAFYMRLWFYDPYGKDNLIYMRRNAANTPARSVSPTNLTFQIRNTQQAAADDFAAGNADVLVTPIQQTQYTDSENYTTTAERATTLGLIFNPDFAAFHNANIRKGLSMGINRFAIGKNSNDDLKGAFSIIPPAVQYNGSTYREQVPEAEAAYDPNAALTTFQTGMQELHMESLDSTKILVCSALMDCDNLHDIIQTWQEVFGFYIGIDEVTEDEYWQRLASKNYSIAVYGITGSANDPAAVLEQFASDTNTFYYENASVDTQIQALGDCSSSAQLLTQCSQLEQTILSDYWFLPIFYKNQYCITSTKNADIAYDAFSGALNFRNAKHFE